MYIAQDIFSGYDASHERLAMPSIIFTQTLPRKIRHRSRTIEIPIPRLRRQNSIRHAGLPIPLRRGFRRPRPVKPAPRAFETRHLRLRVHHEPGFVGVGVGRWIGVGGRAGAGGGFGGAIGGKDGDSAVRGVQGSFPAGTSVDVVEVGGAVGVGLRPFAAESRSEAVESMSKRLSYFTCPENNGFLPSGGVLAQLHLTCPPSTSILHLRRVVHYDQVRIKDCVFMCV